MKEFKSAGAFAAHLSQLAFTGPAVTADITAACAEEIRDNAKARIGHYQEQIGPFNTWPLLAESTEAQKAALGYPTGAPLLREGDLRDSITEVHRGNEAQIGSTSPIAVFQELGTDRIPPRPFIGPAALGAKKKAEIRAAVMTMAWVAGLNWLRQKSIPGAGGSQ